MWHTRSFGNREWTDCVLWRFWLCLSGIVATADAECSLKAITTYSLFHSEAELFSQFQEHLEKGGTGSHIVIYNLQKTSAGHLEFDLVTDETDIMIPDDAHNISKKAKYKRQDREDWHPAMDYSLRVQIYA